MNITFNNQKQAAGTLVDVLMAIAVIGVMATGLVGSLTYGFFTMGITRENQRATQILLETVETIRLYNWSQVNSNGFIPSTFTGVYDRKRALELKASPITALFPPTVSTWAQRSARIWSR